MMSLDLVRIFRDTVRLAVAPAPTRPARRLEERAMHVKKKADGKFVVVDEPTHLTGKAAADFLKDMRKRDQDGPTPEQQRFLEECDRIYAGKGKSS
jgi:hypothetical protein